MSYKFGYREFLAAGGGADGFGAMNEMECDTAADAAEYLDRFPVDRHGFATATRVGGKTIYAQGPAAYAAGEDGYLPSGDNPILE